jgi:Rrf2 family protein
MRVSARSDYALRAVAELASAGTGRLKRDVIANRQAIPLEFLESILLALKHAGIVQSQRGAGGGFWLARPPNEISLGDVIRAVDGPMSDVRGDRAEDTAYSGPAKRLQDIWIAVRASLREVLDGTTVEDLVTGKLPKRVRQLTEDPEAWTSLGRIRGAARSKLPRAIRRRIPKAAARRGGAVPQQKDDPRDLSRGSR